MTVSHGSGKSRSRREASLGLDVLVFLLRLVFVGGRRYWSSEIPAGDHGQEED